MKSKRIVITLIVTIMLFSTVACGTTNRAEESKSTDATTKEVTTTSTVAPTEATTTATTVAVPTTKATTAVESTTKQENNRKLVNTLRFNIKNDLKLSEETCKNVKEYLEGKIWTKGEVVNFNEIQYQPEEYDSIICLVFNIRQGILYTKSNYVSTPMEQYVIEFDAKIEVEVSYDSERIIIKKFRIQTTE